MINQQNPTKQSSGDDNSIYHHVYMLHRVESVEFAHAFGKI